MTCPRQPLRTLAFSLWTSAFVFAPSSLWACAACFGQSDSPMAQGMNWGILSLLFMIGLVLGGVVAFFVCLARKSAALSAAVGGRARHSVRAVNAENPSNWGGSRAVAGAHGVTRPTMAGDQVTAVSGYAAQPLLPATRSA